jgi:hypothetical protein
MSYRADRARLDGISPARLGRTGRIVSAGMTFDAFFPEEFPDQTAERLCQFLSSGV